MDTLKDGWNTRRNFVGLQRPQVPDAEVHVGRGTLSYRNALRCSSTCRVSGRSSSSVSWHHLHIIHRVPEPFTTHAQRFFIETAILTCIATISAFDHQYCHARRSFTRVLDALTYHIIRPVTRSRSTPPLSFGLPLSTAKPSRTSPPASRVSLDAYHAFTPCCLGPVIHRSHPHDSSATD